MDWYQRLNLGLRQRGWTRAELAERSGVAFRDLVRYRGTQPKTETLVKIAFALDVEPEWLLQDDSASEAWPVSSGADLEDRREWAFSLAVEVADQWEADLFGTANIIAHTTLVTHLYQYIVDNQIETAEQLGSATKPPGW